MVDWFIDLFFKRDVTRLKTPIEEKIIKSIFNESENSTMSVKEG
jgi:hypothetical protein